MEEHPMLTEATPNSWRVTEGTVPLSDVMKTAKCSYASLDVATRNGLIPVVRQGGRGNARHITLDDALLIIAVAALAVAAGLAFGAMLRAVRDTGATITPAGLTIPLAPAS
jgi:hypothetical protein